SRCGVRDDSDQRREFWWPFEQGWIGACERAQRPRKQRQRDKSERSCWHRQRNDSGEVMMQRAAFILHVADPMAMIGMPAGRGGMLACEHVHGMTEHHGADAGDLREKKQPKKPRAEAPLRVQQQQCPPLALDVRVELGTTPRTRNPASGILFGFVAAEPQILR